MKNAKLIEMLPNDVVRIKDTVQITSNFFCDIEVKIDDKGHILIHIAGTPIIKRIIYG